MNDKTLPGTQIAYKDICSTGVSTDTYGVGRMDFSLFCPNQATMWRDLGEVNFSSPTAEQLEDAQTSPAYSEGDKARVNINRRVSRKQAEIINQMIILTLKGAFNGVIPADDEIDQVFEQWKEDNGFY